MGTSCICKNELNIKLMTKLSICYLIHPAYAHASIASRVHVLVQYLIFSCFGCVVINHQKDGDCEENGPDPFGEEFWCLMINITVWTNGFHEFVF
jgi:hypothetical protein